MDPLQTVLSPVAALLNRNIRESTPARELLSELQGSTIAIRVVNTGLAAWFVISDDSVELLTDSDEEPDVIISGSLLTLARMAGSSGEAAIRDGSLELSGDAETAKAFQELLDHARPDIEEEVSSVVGDVAAHRLGEIVRGLRGWAGNARATMGTNIREYLQEESRELPSRYEVERFGERINVLRDDVDRLSARLERLERGD